jgi:hypothetical protein
MKITAPTAEELAQLRAAHAHRFPQTATLHPRADGGGGTIDVPIVIGLPSGASRMPAGAPVSPIWHDFVRGAISGRGDPPSLRDLMARDVVLFPAPGDLEEILDRWPGIAGSITDLALQKTGRGATSIPAPTNKPPSPVAEYLAAHPRATWRIVRPTKSDAFAIAIEPPSSPAWTVFTDGARERDNDAWKLVQEFVAACVSGFAPFDDGALLSVDAALARWPGVALALLDVIGDLAGVGAAAELGE